MRDFHDLLARDLFLQRICHIDCRAGDVAPLFDPMLYDGYDTSLSAVFAARAAHPAHRFWVAHDQQVYVEGDVLLKIGAMTDLDLPHRIQQPRAVVCESGDTVNFSCYDDAFGAAGYRLHRCLMVPTSEGSMAFMDFHRED